MRKYLFGPVPKPFADQNLEHARQRGACLTFHTQHDAEPDIKTSWNDSWQELIERLPAQWSPDAIVLYLPYAVLPSCFWSAPIPLIGLAGDVVSLWPLYKKILPLCDSVVSTYGDRDALSQRLGKNVHAADLGALHPALPYSPPNTADKDIDVLALTGEPRDHAGPWRIWLHRFQEIAHTWRIRVCCIDDLDLFAELCPRAKIVFALERATDQVRWLRRATQNRALVFAKSTIFHSSAPERDADYFVTYDESNWLHQLEYYLTHDAERNERVRTAASRLHQRPLPTWDDIEERLYASEHPPALDKDADRFRLSRDEILLLQAHQALLSDDTESINWVRQEIQSNISDNPNASAQSNALALLYTSSNSSRSPAPDSSQRALYYFERAASRPNTPIVAQLNVLLAKFQSTVDPTELRDASELILGSLASSELPVATPDWDGLLFSPREDVLSSEWARICWTDALLPTQQDEAKRLLFRWRLHQLLGGFTDDVNHFYEAAVIRPDLPSSHLLLAEALAEAGQQPGAVLHFRQSLQADPQQRGVVARLFGLLQHAEDSAACEQLRRTYDRLHDITPQWFPPDEWDTVFPPSGQALATIIVICGGPLNHTEICVQSLLRNTRKPYELIVVDNGSPEKTSEYLRRQQSCSGPRRFLLLRHIKPIAVADAMKRASAIANGEFIVQMNDNVIVSPRWLDGLIAASLTDWPRVGVVGPACNDASGPQYEKADLQNLVELETYFGRRSTAIEQRCQQAERLSTCCRLFRRYVLDQLIESPDPANSDPSDFDVRAQRFGLECRVARDVYVHRLTSAVQKDSQKKQPPARITPLNGKASVSLCMIVKNEEKNLAACLQPAADLVDEIIVVDTGSTDRTKDIAAGFGARIADFPWIDDFAAARNESLRHSTRDWIFWMDADDRLDADNQRKLKKLFNELPNELAAYLMRCTCPAVGDVNRSSTTIAHARLFRRHPALRWRYRVHEQILLPVKELGGKTYHSEVTIHHEGYKRGTVLRGKLERNVALLRKNVEEAPDDPYLLFYLGWSLMQLDDVEEATAWLQKCRRHINSRLSFAPKLYSVLVDAYRRQGENDAALRTCQEGRQRFPKDNELIFVEAGMYLDTGRLDEAHEGFSRLLKSQPEMPLSGFDPGILTYKAHHNLAVVYVRRHDWRMAEVHFRECLKSNPSFLAAHLGLGETYLFQKNFSDAERTAEELKTSHPESAESAVLQARLLAYGKQYEEAVELLQEAGERMPDQSLTRLAAAQILRRQSVPRATLVTAWQEVLAVEPNHAEAKKQLVQLSQQQ